MSVTTAMTAKKRDIKLNRVWKCKDARSRCIIPEVSHEENVLYIESENYIPSVTISVKSMENGEVVYDEVSCVNGKMSFYTNLGNGRYEIEMVIGDNVFNGQFEIGIEDENA